MKTIGSRTGLTFPAMMKLVFVVKSKYGVANERAVRRTLRVGPRKAKRIMEDIWELLADPKEENDHGKQEH